MKVIPQKNKIKNFFSFLKIIIFSIKLKEIILTSCDYGTPILRSGNCNRGCTPAQLESNNCNINNTLIQTQFLNNMIQISPGVFKYVDITTTLKGDLLLEATSIDDSQKDTRYFYGLKQNGRGYFKDKITNKEISNYSLTNAGIRNYESFIFTIILNDTEDNNEYLINISKDSENNLELYDFNNDYIYEKVLSTFFHSNKVRCMRASIIKISDSNYNYILGIIALNYDKSGTGISYFILVKLLFYSKDIVNNDPIEKIEKTISSRARIVSCFETDKKYIMCFYQNVSYDYIIGVYDNNLNNKTFLIIQENGNSDEKVFFKSIHFNGETGIFGYYIINSNEESNLYIQFKKYDENNNNISDHFISKPLIKIDKVGNLSNKIQNNDIIKLSNSKFCFSTFNSEATRFYVIIVNNYQGEKIKIRYYYVNFHQLYYYRHVTELELSLYNNFIGMAVGCQNDYDSEKKQKSYFWLFSYPNSTDFDIDITENVINYNNIQINLKEKCFIHNNLFGYIFYGIKIITFNNEYTLLSVKTGNEINEEIILFEEEIIELVLSQKINIPKKGIIEYAMVLTEPDYDSFNEYSPIIDTSYCNGEDDEINYFNQEKMKYVGKSSYINIILNTDSESITNNCINDKNCEICKNDDDMNCITCKYSFKIENENKICLSNNNTIQSDIEASKESENIETTKEEIDSTITQFCSNEDEINNKCSNNKITIEQLNEIKNRVLTEDYINNKENTIIKTKNAIIQLSTLEDQQNSDEPDISNIDLGECEILLKDSIGLPSSEDLIIYKTDIKSEDGSATYVIYEIYNPYNLDQLDLSICKDVEITINVPVILNNKIEELYDSLSGYGYNVFDGNDSFYQDICTSYTTINGTDILLSDRKTDIYTETQNQTICQIGCSIQSYNNSNKKAKCDCKLNNDTSQLTDFNFDNLFSKAFIEENFFKSLSNSNFRVLKCFKLLFDSKIIKNYGEIIMIIIFVAFVTLIVISIITCQKVIRGNLNIIIKNKIRNDLMKNNDNNIKKKKNKKGIKTRGSIEMNSKTSNNNTNYEPSKRKHKKNVENKKIIIKDDSQSRTGNIYQSNIYLNLNMIKSNQILKSKNIKFKHIHFLIKRKSPKNTKK